MGRTSHAHAHGDGGGASPPKLQRFCLPCGRGPGLCSAGVPWALARSGLRLHARHPQGWPAAGRLHPASVRTPPPPRTELPRAGSTDVRARDASRSQSSCTAAVCSGPYRPFARTLPASVHAAWGRRQGRWPSLAAAVRPARVPGTGGHVGSLWWAAARDTPRRQSARSKVACSPAVHRLLTSLPSPPLTAHHHTGLRGHPSHRRLPRPSQLQCSPSVPLGDRLSTPGTQLALSDVWRCGRPPAGVGLSWCATTPLLFQLRIRRGDHVGHWRHCLRRRVVLSSRSKRSCATPPRRTEGERCRRHCALHIPQILSD